MSSGSERSASRGLVWQAAAGGYVAALCHGTPRQVVLSSLVGWARKAKIRVKGVLIEDLRGGLDAARSDCLDRLSGMLKAPVVVLSDSTLTRGAAACHLLGEQVFGFRRDDLQAAMERLGADDQEQNALRAALWALKVARRLEKRRRPARQVRVGSSAC